ncbi:MAG: T9SS type A sorting domain-containing protein, partial [Bacteroidota bacterium]
TFPAPVNKTFCNFKPDCGLITPDLSVAAHDDCVLDQQIQYSWTVDLYDDGVTDIGSAYAGQGQNTTHSYPNGTHEITYAAFDGCGNTGFTSFKFTIEDCKKPTVFCKAGLIVEMMQGGQVSVNVLQLEEGNSFDNCTTRPNLQFSFSPNVNDTIRIYDCSLLGSNYVEVWATDEENNQDYCFTNVIIQDNMDACGGNLVVLNGKIANEENEGVEDVSVELNGNSTASTFTATQGTYQFSGIAAGYDYTVTPHLDQNPLNGVSTFDLVLLNRHILGIISLDSPYKIISADVNRNGVISISDVIDLRKVILHITPTFPNNTSWRFVDKAHVFPNPASPFSPAFPEVCNVNDLVAGSPNTDFVALKIGDLNGNAAPGSLAGENEDRTGGSDFVLRTGDRQVKAGELVTAEFSANLDGILGSQFTLNFDRQALDFEKLNPGGNASEQNFGLSLLEEGAVTASWNQLAASADSPLGAGGEILFTLIFKAKQNGKLSDWLDVNSRYTKAESYDRQGNAGSVTLKFNGGTGIANRFELFQNVPNPFGEATVIGFQLPENSPASLTIFDLSGRVVKEIRGEFLKGYHEISVGKSDLPGTGVFYYRLETPRHTASKKMIIW